MENEPLNSVYNCGRDCSYVTGLANNNSLAKNYYVKSCSSLADYLVLTGAGNFSYPCTQSGGSACSPLNCGSLWPISAQNIVDLVEASGRTWKAYMEDYPGSGSGTNYSTGGCYLGDSGAYVAKHNPFVYYKDIENSTSRCSRIVRANTVTTTSGPETDDRLLNDLQSVATASSFTWLTPNVCDDTHDSCYGSSSVAEGNQYLSVIVPKILASYVFRTQRAALFITWDEGVLGTPATLQPLAAIWAGSIIKTHYCNCTTTPYYSHPSLPKTLEAVWSLRSLGRLDVTAPAMLEFFN